MGIFYNPPPPFMGGAQPYDPRKGVPPSVLNNDVDQPPSRFSNALLAAVLVAWIPGPPGPYAPPTGAHPYAHAKLAPSLLHNQVDQPPPSRQTWFDSVIRQWKPPPELPIVKEPLNPALIAEVGGPPARTNPAIAIALRAWNVPQTYGLVNGPVGPPAEFGVPALDIPPVRGPSPPWLASAVAQWKAYDLPIVNGPLSPSLLNNVVDDPPVKTNPSLLLALRTWNVQPVYGLANGPVGPPAEFGEPTLDVPPVRGSAPPWLLSTVGQWTSYLLPELPGKVHPSTLHNQVDAPASRNPESGIVRGSWRAPDLYQRPRPFNPELFEEAAAAEFVPFKSGIGQILGQWDPLKYDLVGGKSPGAAHDPPDPWSLPRAEDPGIIRAAWEPAPVYSYARGEGRTAPFLVQGVVVADGDNPPVTCRAWVSIVVGQWISYLLPQLTPPLNPALLNNVVDNPPPHTPYPDVARLWVPGPPGPYLTEQPYASRVNPPSILDNTVDQPPSRAPYIGHVIRFSWEPGPPIIEHGLTAPKIVIPFVPPEDPPRHSLALLLRIISGQWTLYDLPITNGPLYPDLLENPDWPPVVPPDVAPPILGGGAGAGWPYATSYTFTRSFEKKRQRYHIKVDEITDEEIIELIQIFFKIRDGGGHG